MSGSATWHAALAVRAMALETAAALLQAKPEELTVADGQMVRLDGSGSAISLAEVARHMDSNSPLMRGRTPGLTAERWFYSDHMTYPYGVHLALVQVDRGTGQVRVERYLVANDVGRAVNPMLVQGQIVGGLAQGIGGALFEEFRYDEQGQPLSTTFADYLIPTIREMPAIDVLIAEDAPSPLNPLGVKGAGEGGTNGAGAAVAAAVDQALGRPGAVTSLPILPQRVLELTAAP